MSLIKNIAQKLRKWADATEAASNFWEQPDPANGSGSAAVRQLSNGAMTIDSPLLYLGTGDVIRTSELAEGVAVFGATGSGKSSSIAALLAQQLLAATLDAAKIGFIVLIAKPDDAGIWQRYAARAGRSNDVIMLEAGGDHGFNFMEQEAARATKLGLRLTENLVSMFIEILTITQGQKQHSDTFWIDSAKELMRNALDLLQAAGIKPSIFTLCDIIESAPLTVEQAESEDWQQKSDCYKAIAKAAEKFAGLKKKLSTLPAKERERLQSAERDFKTAHDYFMVKFPEMDERPRSGVLMMFSSLIDMFRRGEMADLFCGKTTFSLEDIERGKILILNLPVLGAMRESGRMAQILMKYLFQRHSQARDVSISPAPVVIFADEAHYFTSPNDVLFMTTARSSRTITIFISQTLRNYQEVLGNRGEISADALLAGFQTKVFCCNGEDFTNQWASRLIGSTWQYKASSGGGQNTHDITPGTGYNSNINVNEQLAAQIEPRRFSELRKGGPANGCYVDCILFQPGKQWANGKNHLEITLNQKQINGEEGR